MVSVSACGPSAAVPAVGHLAPSGTATSAATTAPPTAGPDDAAASAAVVDAGQAQPAAGTALAAALVLPVKGRAPLTGYTRDQFGQSWKDTDRNGCDQRNDVLARDLTGIAYEAGTHGCVVLTGTLADPYGGTTIAFTRGQETSSAVQIDHVVALADAWQKGAQQWDAARRESFANDLRNLVAVSGPLNDQKGAGDTATWLPPNTADRCTYVAGQVGVKSTYGLWVTQAEQDAMVRVLSTCPDQPLPTGLSAPAAPPAAPVAPPAAPVVAPAAAPAAPPAAPATVTYTNCTAVRAAGAAPIHIGDPGYAAHLDRDGDGIGCE
jgi:hypothetical protein